MPRDLLAGIEAPATPRDLLADTAVAEEPRDLLADFMPEPAIPSPIMAQAPSAFAPQEQDFGLGYDEFAAPEPTLPAAPTATWGETMGALPGQVKQDFIASVGGAIQAAGEMTYNPIDLAIEQVTGAKTPLPKETGLGEFYAETGAEIAAGAEEEQQRITPKDQTFAQQTVGGAARSLAAMIPGVIASVIAKSPVPLVGAMGAQEGGRSYAEARAAGKSPAESRAFAGAQMTAEMLPEAYTAKVLFKAGTPAFKRAVETLWREVPGENLTTVVQSINAWLAGLDDNLTMQGLFDRLKLTTSVAALAGGGQSLVASGIHAAGEKLAGAPEEAAASAPRDLLAEPTPKAPLDVEQAQKIAEAAQEIRGIADRLEGKEPAPAQATKPLPEVEAPEVAPTVPEAAAVVDPAREKLKSDIKVFWHGSPSGDLRGSAKGLHIGTHEAARQALNARIGIPAQGDWDGTREYGRTLLAGQDTLKKIDPRGYNITGFNVDAPKEDYYPTGKAKYGGGEVVGLTSMPNITPVRIKGKMTNTRTTPHEDFKANAYMQAQIKRGRAKSGYYYENVGEDAGSISAVVPSADHIELIEAAPVEAPEMAPTVPEAAAVVDPEAHMFELKDQLVCIDCYADWADYTYQQEKKEHDYGIL